MKRCTHRCAGQNGKAELPTAAPIAEAVQTRHQNAPLRENPALYDARRSPPAVGGCEAPIARRCAQKQLEQRRSGDGRVGAPHQEVRRAGTIWNALWSTVGVFFSFHRPRRIAARSAGDPIDPPRRNPESLRQRTPPHHRARSHGTTMRRTDARAVPFPSLTETAAAVARRCMGWSRRNTSVWFVWTDADGPPAPPHTSAPGDAETPDHRAATDASVRTGERTRTQRRLSGLQIAVTAVAHGGCHDAVVRNEYVTYEFPFQKGRCNRQCRTTPGCRTRRRSADPPVPGTHGNGDDRTRLSYAHTAV